MSIRYYLYISDSKVDMLLPQIDPAFTRKRTSELNLSLKIFGAKRGTESSVGAERTARLERVVRYLQDHGDLGSVDEPGQFFGGLLPIQWGPFTGDTGSPMVGRSRRRCTGCSTARRRATSRPVRTPIAVVLRDAAVPIRQRVPSIPRRLAAVIDEALIDNPRITVITADELQRALRDAL